MNVADVLLLVAGALSVTYAIISHHRMWQACTRGPTLRRRAPYYPTVTVIRPVRGLDSGAAGNIATAFEHIYPAEVNTVFVFDDETDPAVQLVRDAMKDRAARGVATDASIVYCGAPPPGRTGKLNAMLAALPSARGELVAFVDSDVRADPFVLRSLVDTLLDDPHNGAAFAPVVVAGPLRTVGDVAYALLLNALYGPVAALWGQRHRGRMPYIMGQFVVMRRDAIAAIGGLERAEGQLVDDMYLGARLLDAGYHNVVATHAVHIIQFGLSIRRFVPLYLRWLAFARTGLPWRVKAAPWLHGMAFWLGLLVAVVGALTGSTLGLILGASGALFCASSLNMLHHGIGGPPLPWTRRWVAFALLTASPVIFALALLRRRVEWRGRSYAVDRHARLAR